MSEQKKESISFRKYIGIALLSTAIALIYTGALVVIFGEEQIQFDANKVPISMLETIVHPDDEVPFDSVGYCNQLVDDLMYASAKVGVEEEVLEEDLDVFVRLNLLYDKYC